MNSDVLSIDISTLHSRSDGPVFHSNTPGGTVSKVNSWKRLFPSGLCCSKQPHLALKSISALSQ
jgi:hypothetical protein